VTRRALLRILAAATVAGSVGVTTTPAFAANYVPISGSGSTWSQNAIDQWRRDVNQFGLQINYAGTGSSDGRNQFRSGTVDFAVSEIPYGITQGGNPDPLPQRPFAYMPIVAGGTSIMYNLQIGGRRVTNLRLSTESVTKIFTGAVKQWNDPLIAKDNPGLTLPARRIVPVVRSDGSGTSAQFTAYMASQQPALWNAYCGKAGLPKPCGTLSQYPVLPGSGFTAQAGSLGVAGYVSQSNNIGTITYVEYSYALNAGFPVAKLLNSAGYYIEPTASSVAVALQKAQINPTTLTANLSQVYTYSDPRTYPMSSYSYMIVPTSTASNFSTDKGRTLAAFAKYFLCEGQKKAPLLGYSPLPINLVQAGFTQIKRIPGADVSTINIASCDNPTFSKSGGNLLAKTAPQPKACDKAGGVTQCPNGTGGAANVSTAVKNGSTGGSGGGGSGSGSGTGTGTTGGGGSVGTNGGTGTTGAGGATGTNGATGTDPLTGGTGDGTTTGSGDGAGGDTQNVAASNPITIGSGSGLTSPTFAILAVLALVGVIVIPPLVFGILRRGGSA
jgi:phosphate ABC transporter phosphate-binding protein